MNAVISFQNVYKSFGPKRVLDGVSFEIPTAEILFILGKSGMGKSVTLKHIVGLLKPDRGDVMIQGASVSQAGPDELSAIRKKCGMVFQHPALLDSLTIFENIAFGLRRTSSSELEISNRVKEVLALVHLDEAILEKKPNEISYGMQKRVSLARTLAPRPQVLLFDEPTTGLDPITTQSINQLIFELSRKLQVTSIVVSHDMGCALKIADRILMLDEGKILRMGTVPEMIRAPEPLIQEFLEETLALLTPDERERLGLDSRT